MHGTKWLTRLPHWFPLGRVTYIAQIADGELASVTYRRCSGCGSASSRSGSSSSTHPRVMCACQTL
eukprot:3425627-Pyramimonas_sp.AAC.1